MEWTINIRDTARLKTTRSHYIVFCSFPVGRGARGLKGRNDAVPLQQVPMHGALESSAELSRAAFVSAMELISKQSPSFVVPVAQHAAPERKCAQFHRPRAI
jgi:hypothetical protein